jgi:two-component system, sensor histidine kinase
VAFADPVILERILRNLVSNAIRYTDDGGVLVSCRQRGDKLLMQVWDSGIGISEATLPRIFDEFYQVQSQRPLEAHQRKGLGLGLAIVARLAALMEAPIDVRSRVGHGTVFSFEVPPGKAVRALEPAAPTLRAPLGLTLQGRLIARGGGRSRGARRPGGAAQGLGRQRAGLRHRGARCRPGWPAPSPSPRRPDLLLVDYRLPQGHDRPGRAGRRAPRIGRAASCRPSSSPAAPSAATRARPPSTTSTC